jgi:hypothetical protein
MSERPAEDHTRARLLSECLNGLSASLRASEPQTNIVQVQVGETGMTSRQWVDGKRSVKDTPRTGIDYAEASLSGLPRFQGNKAS